MHSAQSGNGCMQVKSPSYHCVTAQVHLASFLCCCAVPHVTTKRQLHHYYLDLNALFRDEVTRGDKPSIGVPDEVLRYFKKKANCDKIGLTIFVIHRHCT